MENLSKEERGLYDELNLLRSNPGELEEKFSIVGKALDRIPTKKKEGRELQDLAKKLKTLDQLPPFEVSPGLCLACKDILHHISEIGKYNHEQSDESDLKNHVRAYTKKFTHLFEIIDHGTIENVLARIMIQENDPKRTYKKAVFQDTYKFVGIASAEIDEELTSVIILADYVEEGTGQREYNPKDYPEIKEAFDLFDFNNIEKIDAKETKKAMIDLGFHIKNPEIFNIIDRLDIEENRLGVDFNTLMDEVMNTVGDDQTKEGLYKIFSLYKDPSEVITLGGLKNITRDLEDKDLTWELERLMKIAKTNNFITFEDFYRVLKPEEA